jgi:hypothetical protein
MKYKLFPTLLAIVGLLVISNPVEAATATKIPGLFTCFYGVDCDYLVENISFSRTKGLAYCQKTYGRQAYVARVTIFFINYRTFCSLPYNPNRYN